MVSWTSRWPRARQGGELNRAEQVRSIGAWRSAGAISRWRFPRDLARHLCALRDIGCTDSARRTEILERRPAGGLRHADHGAAASLPQRAEAAGLGSKAGLKSQFQGLGSLAQPPLSRLE